MNAPERRSISLAGLSLIGAGAVLGLTLAVPASASASSASEGSRATQTESAAVVKKDHPDK